MPNITLTNLTSAEVFINFLYVSIPAGDSIEVFRAASDLMYATRLQELVQDGTLSVDIEYTADERASFFDIFPGLSLPSGPAADSRGNVRYVNVNASSGGNGGLFSPYQRIQDAIDEMEAIGGFSRSNPYIVKVEPGTYDEALVFHGSGFIIQGTLFDEIRIRPSDPTAWPVTVTNATPESLEIYNASGDYGDLVNQGSSEPDLGGSSV